MAISNKRPDNAIFLLDLYKKTMGMTDTQYEYVKDLLNTAYQEGILYQLAEDTFKPSNYGNTFQHHRRAEEN